MRPPFPACLALLVLPLLAPPAAAEGVPACTETGIASYYGPGFYGRPTASGEIFDATAMTAAHKFLPLGTEVVVVREDGAAIEVVINDRGPFIDGRIIDLSEGAAEALGMIDAGIVPVTVAIYAEGQDDPSVRLALAARSGLPLRRPSLLRLFSLEAETAWADEVCAAPASTPDEPPPGTRR